MRLFVNEFSKLQQLQQTQSYAFQNYHYLTQPFRPITTTILSFQGYEVKLLALLLIAIQFSDNVLA